MTSPKSPINQFAHAGGIAVTLASVLVGCAGGGAAASRSPQPAAPTVTELPVSFTNGAATLHGTLFVPAAAGRHPAVLMMNGSGSEGRSENRPLAAELARNGVAALIYDKRGVGESTGDWRTAGFEELSADAIRGMGLLGQRPEIDPARIGVYGYSQSATMAPLVALQNSTLSFIVAVSPSGVSADSAERYSLRNSLGVNALAGGERALAESYVDAFVATAFRGAPRARLDSVARSVAGKPWYVAPPSADDGYWKRSARVANYAPSPQWSAVTDPVMLLFGAADERIPPDASRDAILAALGRDPQRLLTVCTYPNADHAIRVRQSGGQASAVAPGFTADVVAWIRVAARLDATAAKLTAACK